MSSGDPAGLAAHWSAIRGVPAIPQDGCHGINVDEQTITIVGAPDKSRERLETINLAVRGSAGILARARQMGLETREDAFALCGMWMKLREETA